MTPGILSIAPYKILPPRSGGQMAITYLHEYLGRICANHVAGTVDNEAGTQYSFTLHKVFPASAKRYMPFNSIDELSRICTTFNISHIICEHPYMALKAIRLARQLNAKWFLRSHNIESERFRALGKPWWRILRAYEQYAMRKADGVLFITEEDAQWAQRNFGLPASKCHFIPYGTVFSRRETIMFNKLLLASELKIEADKPWLYFLGALDYGPNREAVSFIISEVAPRLRKQRIDCEILIAGKGLDEALQQQIAAIDNMHYTGFVSDLNSFIGACDVMLNPVITGGGIKTKAVEALGYNKRVVSTHSGAAGLNPDICGNNLRISADNDWDSFANNVMVALRTPTNVPDSFYQQYYFGNIAEKVLSILETTSRKRR